MLFTIEIANHLVMTRTTIEISSTPIAFFVLSLALYLCVTPLYCIACTYIAE